MLLPIIILKLPYRSELNKEGDGMNIYSTCCDRNTFLQRILRLFLDFGRREFFAQLMELCLLMSAVGCGNNRQHGKVLSK